MQPQNPYPQPYPPSGLVAPLGPPQRVPAGVRLSALVLLGAAVVAMSVFGGYEVTLHGGNRLQVLLWFLPAIAAFAAMSFVALGTVWSPRCDGRVLQGTGLLGAQGIDLTRLVSVASTTTRRAVSLSLRDDQGGIAVEAGRLQKAGPVVLDAVGQAVWAGQQQGRYLVPVSAAAVWGMPPAPGAPKNGRTGALPVTLGAVGLLLVGIVVGVVLGLQ